MIELKISLRRTIRNDTFSVNIYQVFLDFNNGLFEERPFNIVIVICKF
jgi:hypothetical protein